MYNEEITSVEMNSIYKHINDVLDADFVEEVTMEELNKQITNEFSEILGSKETNSLIKSIGSELTSLSEKTEQISNSLTTARIQDEDFLNREIKSVMLSSRRVLEIVEKNIKIGSSPRDVEVYATLLNAITGQFKELRNLNESMAKFVLENKKQNLEEVKEDHKMILSSNDALNMLMNARTNSKTNAIDADFDILED